jgi:hypothetical protein
MWCFEPGEAFDDGPRVTLVGLKAYQCDASHKRHLIVDRNDMKSSYGFAAQVGYRQPGLPLAKRNSSVTPGSLAHACFHYSMATESQLPLVAIRQAFRRDRGYFLDQHVHVVRDFTRIAGVDDTKANHDGPGATWNI